MINKSWKNPSAAKQEIIQRDAAGNNFTWSLKCREFGFEMAIFWYRVAKGHKVRRLCSGQLLHRIILVRQTA